MRVVPHFGPFARVAPLTLDSAEVIVIRPAADTIDRRGQHFDVNAQQLPFSISILLHAPSESLDVSILLFAGTTLLFQGQQTVVARTGVATSADSIPVQYKGPGSQMAALTIAPRDTSVPFGASFTYQASAIDSLQAPVPSFYVSWKASAGTINAAGTFTAPALRDTVTIRAVTPTGIKDSTRVFVVATAAALTKVSGDGQTGAPSTRLAQPLIVQVNGTDQLPVSGVKVTFAAATGGGAVDSATATTNGQGQAETGATLGSALGAQTFTATVSGLATVTFTATATTSGGARTWTGAASTDWNTAGNWNPAGVPTNADDVVIPSGTANAPTLSNSGSAKSVTVNTGATLNLATFSLSVAGNVFGDGPIVGTGSVQIATTAQIRGTLPGLIASGAVTAAGAVVIGGNLTVTGSTGNFVLGNQTAAVSGNLAVQGGAILTMVNAQEALTVGGNASFAGGSELGHLTAGTIAIGGNFSQIGTGGASADSYHPTGTHLTTLLGATPTVTFGTPGSASGSSMFQEFAWASGTTLTLGSDVYITGTATVPTSGATTITSAGHKLTTGNLVTISATTTFNNTPLVISQSAAVSVALNNLTFQSMATTATQLTVNHPGTASPLTFTNVKFLTTPTTGFYLAATDINGGTDGVQLVINMLAPTPATPGGFVLATGGASVVWPAAGGIIWTGTTSTSWTDPTNWNPARVPTTTDDATIPAGTPNAPNLTSSISLRNLTVASQATLVSSDFTITLSGNLDASGLITSCCSLVMTGNGVTAKGTLNGMTLGIPAGAKVSLSGALTLANAGITVNGGELVINGQVLSSSGSLTVSQGGLLTMTNANDFVTVLDASFDGASEVGHLTAGTLTVDGNFTQAASTSGASFQASGTHLTNFVGATPTITFASAGTGATNSLFQGLGWSGGASLTLGSNVIALGSFSRPLTSAGTISGSGATLTLGNLTSLGPITFNDVALAINQPAAVNVSLSNLTFQGLASTATQLSITHPGTAAALSFTNLVFSVTPTGGGLYLAATDANASDGVPLTINMVSPTPTIGAPFVKTANGAVVNWPPAAPGVVIWTGGAGTTSWTTGANWNTGVVPTSTDSAIITQAATTPVLTTATGVGAINVASGTLTVGGQTLAIARTLATTGTGTLTMTNAADQVVVAGNAIFGGGSTTGLLTAGTLTVGQNFTQVGPTTTSFDASTGHLTKLAAASPTISFANPGATLSHFGNLTSSLYNPVFNLTSSVVTLGTLNGGDGFGGTLKGVPCGVTFTVQQIVTGSATFNCVALILNDPSGSTASLNNVSFFNLPNTATQLTIQHPGLAGVPFTLNNITFEPLSAGNTGFYISATDVDGVSPLLNVNVAGNDPGNGPTFTKTSGGATVTWPAGGVVTWTGGAGTSNWSDTNNWNPKRVPTISDSVVVVASTTTPVLSVPSSIAALNVTSGTLTTNGQFLSIVRSLSTTGTGTLTMTNASDYVIVGGNASFAGGSTLNLLTAGQLQIGGNFSQSAVTSTTSFAPSGTHMTILGSVGARTASFGSPGSGAAGSHFMSLDISQATGGVSLTVNTIVDSAFSAVLTSSAPILLGGGASLTAKEWLVSGLVVDNAPMILNEGASGLPQTFDNVTFQNFPTTGSPGFPLMSVSLSGGVAAARSVTFNGTILQTSFGGGTGTYLQTASTNGFPFTLIMAGSNDVAGGPARSAASTATTITWQ